MKRQISKQFAYGLCATAALALLPGLSLRTQAQGGAKQVVALGVVAPGTVAAGKPVNLDVTLTIDEGYHIQGNPAKEGYIATVVTVAAPASFKPGKLTYPKAVEQSIAGDTLPVYEKQVTIHGLVTPTKPGKYKLPVTVRYQACNDRACFPPTTITATATIVVTGKGAAVKH